MPEALALVAAGPLPWLGLTVVAWAAALRLQRALGGSAWANPVLLATAIVVAALAADGAAAARYPRYLAANSVLELLLGSAVVALAVPLRRHWPEVRAMALRIAVGVVAGQLVAAVVAVALLGAFGAPRELLLSTAPKSVTAPVAMALAHDLGGVPALAAVLVVATGMFGAMAAATLFRLIAVDDPARCGLALGVASHGIGTARAFQALGRAGGSFAAVGMTLSTVVGCALVPLVARWL